jgi:hypothetical protein
LLLAPLCLALLSGCHPTPARLTACAAHPSSPSTIDAAVARLNGLPSGADVACFVASLQRPLSVVAATSLTSAQPSPDAATPRLFLLLEGLVVTVLPDGDDSHLLELGQWVDGLRTVKGELELPASAPFAADAPYTRIMYQPGMTKCALCHRGEAASTTVSGGWASDAYQPTNAALTPLSALAAAHDGCTSADTSPRCTFLHALFDFGEVRTGAFDTAVAHF